MKKVQVTFLVVLFLLLSMFAIQLQALAGGDQVSRKDFAIVGQVVGVDVTAGCIYVNVSEGFGYYGVAMPLPLMTDGETNFSPQGVSLETIQEGDIIRASGDIDFLAEQVTIVTFP
jgi:hypothetical protein